METDWKDSPAVFVTCAVVLILAFVAVLAGCDCYKRHLLHLERMQFMAVCGESGRCGTMPNDHEGRR